MCHLILHTRPRVLDWIEIWVVSGSYQHRDLVTRSAIVHEDRATVDVHVQIQVLFE